MKERCGCYCRRQYIADRLSQKTANTLFWIKCGRIKISGINKISFLKQASNKLTFACPNAMKLC